MASGDVPVYIVRKMRNDDIQQVVEIWKETGLAEGTNTIHTWYQVDPDGFYVAASKEGEIYGVCSAVCLNENLAFLGLYAVKSNYQKKGIGVKIWKTAMEHVGYRNAGLNSVPEHLHTYRDLAGFSIVSPWQTVVYESKTVCPDKLINSIDGIEVAAVGDSILEDLIYYDSLVHGFNRSKIVTLSAKEENALTMVAKSSDRNVCGYGTIKQNVQVTALIGPLYADSPDLAELLLLHLIEAFPSSKQDGITLMAVDSNMNSQKVAEKLGLKKMMEVPRCYRKLEVVANFSKIYGQHALNFSTF